MNYQQNKSECQITESKIENGDTKVNVKKEVVDCFTQTEYIHKNKNESQTEVVSVKDVEVNTVAEEILKLDGVLGVKENGAIEARNGNEKVIEMRISHDVKSWEEIELYVQNNLGMTMTEKPWIPNSGNFFKTMGLRTTSKDYKGWKLRAFNWQESSIRAISSSRVYK